MKLLTSTYVPVTTYVFLMGKRIMCPIEWGYILSSSSWMRIHERESAKGHQKWNTLRNYKGQDPQQPLGTREAWLWGQCYSFWVGEKHPELPWLKSFPNARLTTSMSLQGRNVWQLEQFMHCCYPNLLIYISHSNKLVHWCVHFFVALRGCGWVMAVYDNKIQFLDPQDKD